MSTIPKVKINIDGKDLEVQQGSMIIEAADNNNITIPRFCYHKKLTVAANCRMCLVDVANSKKPVPACATPVADGMVIQTKSPKALAYQKAVMEFLLINHPLDCPICDQGGECELQDQAMGYGKDVSRYNQGKRSVADKDIGPLVETDLTRCIQCTRCVRFGAEIAGIRELGMLYRGEHEEISTFLNNSVNSELSGNIIDLCPVGALTNKPYRYQARAWELQQHAMISPHDCVGSHVSMHVRRGEALRCASREKESLNEVWISDRDRYSVHAMNTSERASVPMIKSKGKWKETDWVTALELVAKKLKTIKNEDSNKIAGLASSQSTVEEFYLLQKLIRGLGCDNVDFRGQDQDFAYQDYMPYTPGINCSFSEINEADVILVVGSFTRTEVPIINHRIRQASLQGAKVYFINPMRMDYNFDVAADEITDFTGMTEAVLNILKQVNKTKPLSAHYQGQIDQLNAKPASSVQQDIAKALLAAQKPIILWGALTLAHPASSEIVGLISALKEVLAAKGGVLTPGPNYAGAYIAGAVPHRNPAGNTASKPGKTIKELLDSKTGIEAYILLNMEPYHDTIYGASVNEALNQAEIVVAITPFVTDYLKKYADVILPMNAYAENSGTFVNVLGDWQSWSGAAKGKGDARPAWKILRVLANLISLPGFDYVTTEDVINELKAYIETMKNFNLGIRLPGKITQFEGSYRLGPTMMYATDMLVRHAAPLQKTLEASKHEFIGIAPEVAAKQGWQEGESISITQDEQKLKLPLKFMPLPENMIYLARMPAIELGAAFAKINLEKGSRS